jgi:hypothetical protein
MLAYCRLSTRGGYTFRASPDKIANPPCELRYRPVKFILARTAVEGAAREAELEGSMAALRSDAV